MTGISSYDSQLTPVYLLHTENRGQVVLPHVFIMPFPTSPFSWGHHFSLDGTSPWMQLAVNWAVIRGAAPANLAIQVPPLHGDITLAWGTPLTGAAPVLSVDWNVIKGAAPANLAIPVPLLFWHSCRCHTYFPVVQLIGLQYSVMVVAVLRDAVAVLSGKTSCLLPFTNSFIVKICVLHPIFFCPCKV